MTEPAQHFRALARRPVSLAARVVQDLQPVGGSGAARLINLGLGGACLELGETVKDGSALRLFIDVPHLWDPLELDGRVAWAQPSQGRKAGRIGVRFEGASGKTLRLLAELLEAAAYSA